MSFMKDDTDVDEEISRALVCHMLAEIMGKQNIPYQTVPTFTDVPGNHPYAKAIAIARAQGWIRGYDDADGRSLGIFKPDAYISRAEIAVILASIHK